MKRSDTPSKPVNRRHSYTKVLDNRKQPIRGLWRRNGNFIARIRVEDELGQKQNKWFPLEASTAAEAQEELRKLLVERSQNEIRHAGESPKLADYVKTYCDRLDVSKKRPASISKEKSCLSIWSEKIGQTRLSNVKPYQINAVLTDLRRSGLSERTVKLHFIYLRVLLKAARTDNYLKLLPTDGIQFSREKAKPRKPKKSPADIEALCQAALKASKNGQQLADYLRLLALSGARRNEALAIQWADVDFEQQTLTIGADGQTKNHETRLVEMTADLKAHLEDMFARRPSDSKWVFPSPQRGDKDTHTKTLKESLNQAKKEVIKTHPHLSDFGFHDCRHLFISQAVMAGLDFFTIAQWVGHKDRGVLIGKVYGDTTRDHRQKQAMRLTFMPQIVRAAA